MKLKYHVINPGGNTTAIMLGNFTKKLKVKINTQILKMDPIIEQVGFWVKPKDKNNDARLEMAGGEFCGNALRSLGALLARQKKKRSFLVESSGTQEVAKIILSKNKSSLRVFTDTINLTETVCKLPGINHILTKRAFTKLSAKNFLKQNGLLKEKAAGVISYKKIKSNTYKINPIVWVSGTKTLYEETACASGTIALAYMLFAKNKAKDVKVIQPSGSVFEIVIRKGSIKLTGPILTITEKQLLF
jgi:diaminopimelate epimerase